MNTKTQKFNDQFSKIKREIFRRDKFFCQVANENCWGPLDVDHIIKRSLQGNNEKKNLITLCRGHHATFEIMPSQDKVKALRKVLVKKYKYDYDDRYQ